MHWPGRVGWGACWQPRLLSADHRQSSHHIHHPLSTHLPPDTRRRKTPQGPGRKPRRRPGASPTGETPTIEEGEEDEEENSEAEGARSLPQLSPTSTLTASSVQVTADRATLPSRGVQGGHPWPDLPYLLPLGPSSSFSKKMKALTARREGPAHLLLHQCPTRRWGTGLPGGPRPGK